MVNRYFYLLRFLLAATDFVLINVCFYVAFYLADKYYGNIDQSIYRDTLIISDMIWLVCAAMTGLYATEKIARTEYIYKTTARSLMLHFGFFVAYLIIIEFYNFPRHFLISFYALTVFGFVFSRFTGANLQNLLTNNADLRKAVGILDISESGLRLAEYFKSESSVHFRGFLNQDSRHVAHREVERSPSVKETISEAVNAGIFELYVCMDSLNMAQLRELIAEGEKHCVRVKFVPEFSSPDSNFKYIRTGDFIVLSSRNEPLESIGNRFRKRLFDIVVSLSVIIFILSWLYPLLALLIKRQSPGPVIFSQQRSGRDNAPFWCYKFRSMKMNNDSGKRQASRNDDRVTPIGHLLRKTSLDEFPQFFNVLKGSMSIIGPRPHMLAHTEQYGALIDKYMVRHFLKPGISGWAQVNGYRGETKDPALMEARVEHDIWYMANWSLWLDIKIMYMTVANIFKGEDQAF